MIFNRLKPGAAVTFVPWICSFYNSLKGNG